MSHMIFELEKNAHFNSQWWRSFFSSWSSVCPYKSHLGDMMGQILPCYTCTASLTLMMLKLLGVAQKSLRAECVLYILVKNREISFNDEWLHVCLILNTFIGSKLGHELSLFQGCDLPGFDKTQVYFLAENTWFDRWQYYNKVFRELQTCRKFTRATGTD